MTKDIIVIADHAGGEVKPTTVELLTIARKIQRFESGAVSAVVLGAHVDTAAQNLARTGGVDVLAVQVPGLAVPNGETCKDVLSEVLPDLSPAYILAVHDTDTWDYLPGLAVRMGGVCVTGVVDLVPCRGSLRFRRAVGSGRLVADVAAGSGPVFLTLQPGVFPPAPGEREIPGRVTYRCMSHAPDRCRSIEIRRAKPRSSALAEAAVVVAAGRGMGREENLEMVRRLARLFQNAAVAGSRLVCDSGWLEYQCQVGLTGATVTPALYVACGISGAPQHLAGMAGSDFIVAINTDPNAAIFNVSDVCIVEDATRFLPLLIEAIQKIEDH